MVVQRKIRALKSTRIIALCNHNARFPCPKWVRNWWVRLKIGFPDEFGAFLADFYCIQCGCYGNQSGCYGDQGSCYGNQDSCYQYHGNQSSCLGDLETLVGYQVLHIYPCNLAIVHSFKFMLGRFATTFWHGCRVPKVISGESRKCYQWVIAYHNAC